MARVVLGLATSHSPLVSSAVEVWPRHAERDRVRADLVGPDGVRRTFDEHRARVWPSVATELVESVWRAKHQRCQRAIAELADTLHRANPGAVVIIGDDQAELFRADGTPALAVYWGGSIRDIALTERQRSQLPPGLREAAWAWHAETDEDYPTASGLAHHLIGRACAAGFDLGQFSEQPAGRGLGHAFVFVRRRLMGPRMYPIVPVFINTFYPPNQPGPGRCYRFGRVLRQAIESWPVDIDVAVVASGGLSHFMVDEQLDRMVLDALRDRDLAAIDALPTDRLHSGSSEIRNWLAAGGAVEHLRMELLDYVPG
ncbi:MAG TPA: hypothetical protein VGH89_26105, partial [Pseudonocardia sp.]